MRITCTGISYKATDLSLREKLSFDADKVRIALEQLLSAWPEAEFLLLSTCNRVEIYLARKLHSHPRQDELLKWLGEFHSLNAGEFETLADTAYTFNDDEAIGHLLAVACGLDSLVPGESQIASQLKQAYASADLAGTARQIMGKLFRGAMHAARQVRSETQIGSGKASVASVAVDLVRSKFATLEGKCVLNVGAGKIGQLLLRQLVKLKPERIVIINRSFAQAQKLAEGCGGQAEKFSRLQDCLNQADVILTSTASAKPIISTAMIRTAQQERNHKPLLIVDLALPRDVSAEAAQVDNVSLHNIDDLDQIVGKTLKMRSAKREQAEEIIRRHVGKLTASLHVRSVSPTIDALYRYMEKIAAEELAAARAKLTGTGNANEATDKIITRALHRTVRKIMHTPVEKLHRSPSSQTAQSHAETIRKLFDL